MRCRSRPVGHPTPLPCRCLTLGLLAMYAPNQYALAATQVFEGIGAGIYDTLMPLVVKRLVKGTGRFGRCPRAAAGPAEAQWNWGLGPWTKYQGHLVH